MGMIAQIIIAAKEQRPTKPSIAPRMDEKEPIFVHWYKSALRTAKNISTMAGTAVHVPGSNWALGNAAVVRICRGASPSDDEFLGNADSDKELLASSMTNEFQNCNSFVKMLCGNIRRQPGWKSIYQNLPIGRCWLSLVLMISKHKWRWCVPTIELKHCALNCASWLHSRNSIWVEIDRTQQKH